MVLEGRTDSQVAEAISTTRRSITRQAVTMFRRRHAAELAVQVAEVERQVTDYAIAHKVNRIAALNDRWQRAHDLIEARAADTRYDEPGYKTGLMVHQLKSVGGGEYATIVDQYVTDTALLAEMRNIEHAAAEELAQLPKAETHLQQNIVLIRQVIGVGDAIPLG